VHLLVKSNCDVIKMHGTTIKKPALLFEVEEIDLLLRITA